MRPVISQIDIEINKFVILRDNQIPYIYSFIIQPVLKRAASSNVKALQKLVPEIQENDIEPGGAGVRAQALEPDGKLVDDFCIVEANKMVNVLNAPSPAATASISIGKKIAEMVIKRF